MYPILPPYLVEATAMRLRRTANRGCVYSDDRVDVCMALLALGMRTIGDAVGHPLGEVFLSIEVLRQTNTSDPMLLSDEQMTLLGIAADLLEQFPTGLDSINK